MILWRIKMLRFIVWGAGGRGKKAAQIFGTNRIVAFIDSDYQKIGKMFCGKPVINFECYKNKYSNYAILISIVDEQPVIDILKKEHIFFFSYNECPTELMGYGWNHAKHYINKIELNEKKVVIYGDTLYSILVYEYLEKNGYECIGLIHNHDFCEQDLEMFNKLFPFISVKELKDIDDTIMVLQTVSEYQMEKKLFGFKVKDIYDWRKFINYENPKIAKLKGKYKGRCFIVATGPSLRLTDLEKLNRNHEFCLSVNSIFTCFNETEWRPDQYIVMDVGAVERYENYFKKMNVRQKFIGDVSIDFDYDNLTNEFYIFHSIFTKDTLEKGLISEDFSKYVYNSGTVTATCFQLAMYEGFEEIYLLGCDCSYFENGDKHFKISQEIKEEEDVLRGKYGVAATEIKMLQYHINAYRKIKKYADSKGIKIYNATRGGYLEVFERVDFDKLFCD